MGGNEPVLQHQWSDRGTDNAQTGYMNIKTARGQRSVTKYIDGNPYVTRSSINIVHFLEFSLCWYHQFWSIANNYHFSITNTFIFMDNDLKNPSVLYPNVLRILEIFCRPCSQSSQAVYCLMQKKISQWEKKNPSHRSGSI